VSDDQAATAEDSAVTFSVLGNDDDIDTGDTLTVTGFTQGAHGTGAFNPDGTSRPAPAASPPPRRA